MEVEPLIAIPIFVHDFLCIHPFNEGNGRMSRLLTTLLLYRCGFYVGKYISLEAKIAKNKDLYYDALNRSQDGWQDGCLLRETAFRCCPRNASPCFRKEAKAISEMILGGAPTQ